MPSRSMVFQVIIVMTAFAANSVLCRLALKGGHIDPVSFSNLRLISGALVLLPFLRRKVGHVHSRLNVINSFLLMIYAVFFSVAYIQLDTGTGALLLFGVVQLTMVIYGLLRGEKFTIARAAGLTLALVGMALLLLPGASAPPLASAVLMGVSGLAWAAYSIRGRSTVSPVQATAKNFVLAVPFSLLIAYFLGVSVRADLTGAGLAILSGAVASAGAYALWYALLPRIESVTASTVQLSVPCIAVLGGVLFLGETLTWRMSIAMIAVLSGIGLVIRPVCTDNK
ncbi:DMT family transporter [Pectobacterium brasiliense]|uniref:DMT family transporter n=1 Tax=Pectobacterium parvum TaxID=2778550 RepID=A0AAP9IK96_9GAMM|nr:MULTISPECIES: DMT family transporter [Pectobacterium]APS30478.1 membrane protein [Pectobacterium brasiliense]ARA76077.1 EamA family transporter [Pectobacterium brasiliense]KHS76003.1 membrane protein [Pectobacterium brasiliense]KHS82001.1 membrane protein [Pectobacterium brasiliense]KHT00421.1 membrane protein [Pectobacterium brasiliense]